MKKVLAVTLAAVMAGSLAACADTGSAGGASSAAAGNSPSGTIELNFWHSMDGGYGEIVEKQVQAFNDTIGAQKGIHVTTTFQDWPGTTALTAAMATDDTENMPDVIQLDSDHLDLVRDWDRTVWVEDYINREGNTVTKNDLIQNAVSTYSIDGKMIGAPYALSTLVLYYNQNLLTQAGYDAPPKTITQMAQMMKDIKSKTSAEYALNARFQAFEFESFIAIQGASGTYFGNNDGGHTGKMTELTCQEQIGKFLDAWQGVVDSNSLKPTKDSMNEEFAQGLNAMVIMSSSKITEIDKQVGNSFEWGVAPIPKVSSDDIGGGFPSGSALFMVDRGDQAKVEASWDFLQYMMSADAQDMWLDGYSYVPVNTKALDTEAYKQAVAANSRLQVPYDILADEPSSVVASFVPSSDAVSDVIQNAMLDFAQGTADRDTTYKAITDGIADAFAEYARTN